MIIGTPESPSWSAWFHPVPCGVSLGFHIDPPDLVEAADFDGHFTFEVRIYLLWWEFGFGRDFYMEGE